MSSISKLKNGVGIFLRDMSNMTVVDNGQAVLLGGGVQSGDVISYLWSHGKQTTTTGCDCVGYVGPILGGGHGWLQGRYGLASDQLISARMVLANGTAISVSNEENKDLFWAIRGAGHNFGVVTQVKMRIYDREKEQDEWAASSFVYTHDKMESVFGLMNSWLDDVVQPEGLVHYGLFVHNADVDPDNPIVIIWVYYQAAFIPRQYVDALNALSPIAVENKVTDLAGVNAHVQADRNGTSCAKGFSRSLVPVSLHRYSLPALRKVVSIFAALPAAYRNSALMLEGFPVNRVHQILAEDSAYPDRGGRLLVSPVLTNVHEKSLDEGAWRITGEIRSALVEGNGGLLVAYVNYARGDETLEEVYGHEAWRLEKLRKLKKAFDPFGRFNFAMPIT
ncbi:hypothetical protein GQ44DRAFT_714144 [Phaeosphaeriaceae sp. PMI808]|nr:hypothetical protein GQ44DRAFT_714144 [Phaeosphaeriaceae sp. PMI808]